MGDEPAPSSTVGRRRFVPVARERVNDIHTYSEVSNGRWDESSNCRDPVSGPFATWVGERLFLGGFIYFAACT